MPDILIVEDDPAIADLIALYLQRDGHRLTICRDGLQALDLLQQEPLPYDLAILDLMLPGLDGRGVARRVRERSGLPIVMVTALDDTRDVLEGFGYGADDYITKPFVPDELVARVRALLRRSGHLPDMPAFLSPSSAPPRSPVPARQSSSSVLRFGDSEIDPDARILRVNGREVELRPREFDLLLALARHPGTTLSRDRLFSLAWGGEFDGDSRTVDVHVSRLRERLADADADLEIRTVRSIGYRLLTGN